MKNRMPIQVVLAIMTTATVVVWVAFGVYQTLRQKAESQVPENILKPLLPQLDTETLDEIGNRLYFDKGETVAFSSQSAIIILETESEEKSEEDGSIQEQTDENIENLETDSTDTEATQSGNIEP